MKLIERQVVAAAPAVSNTIRSAIQARKPLVEQFICYLDSFFRCSSTSCAPIRRRGNNHCFYPFIKVFKQFLSVGIMQGLLKWLALPCQLTRIAKTNIERVGSFVFQLPRQSLLNCGQAFVLHARWAHRPNPLFAVWAPPLAFGHFIECSLAVRTADIFLRVVIFQYSLRKHCANVVLILHRSFAQIPRAQSRNG